MIANCAFPITCASATFTIAAIFLAPGLVTADLEKEDLEKKQQEVSKPELGQTENPQQKVAKKGAENLAEINRLLDEVKDNLANKNTGTATQEKQQKAVNQLEELIQEIARMSQQSSASSGGSSGQQPNQPQPSKGEQPQPQKRKPQEEQKSEEMQQKREQEQNDQLNRNDQRRDRLPPADKKQLTPVERLRLASRWGMLPTQMTEALSASEKEAPAQYRAVVDRYYKKLGDYHDKKR